MKRRKRPIETAFGGFCKTDLMPSHLANKDAIGDAYEYLISNFASDAGKSRRILYAV